MNRYSQWRQAALVAALVVAGACGGSDGGKATNKADWEKEHGPAVSAVSTDLDQARQALSGGQRQLILSACTQLKEDVVEARKALPVPEPTVDTALRTALDAVDAGVPECIDGARIANQAHLTEAAIAKFRDAQPKMEEATKAIENWV